MSHTVKCEEGKWLTEARMEGKHFIAEIVSECLIQESQGHVTSLYQYYYEKIKKHSQVHDESSAVMLDHLPATFLEFTDQSAEGRIRIKAKLATDHQKLFKYSAQSVDVQLNGLGKFLKKLDFEFILQKISDSEFKLQMITKSAVQKPSLVPTGMFLSKGKTDAMAKFNQKLTELAHEIKSQL
jgi:hypothetical protein